MIFGLKVSQPTPVSPKLAGLLDSGVPHTGLLYCILCINV